MTSALTPIAYGVASSELVAISTAAAQVKDEPAFSAYVLGAESAISREHNLWDARRV